MVYMRVDGGVCGSAPCRGMFRYDLGVDFCQIHGRNLQVCPHTARVFMAKNCPEGVELAQVCFQVSGFMMSLRDALVLPVISVYQNGLHTF